MAASSSSIYPPCIASGTTVTFRTLSEDMYYTCFRSYTPCTFCTSTRTTTNTYCIRFSHFHPASHVKSYFIQWKPAAEALCCHDTTLERGELVAFWTKVLLAYHFVPSGAYRRLCHQHSSDNTRHHEVAEETSNSVPVTASTMDRLHVSLETLIITYQRMYNLDKSLFTRTARRMDDRSYGPTTNTPQAERIASPAGNGRPSE